MIRRVEESAGTFLPEGRTAIFTLTAPIRLPAKTAEEIASLIRSAATRRAARVDLEADVHGNRVRVCVVTGRRPDGARTAGYVHNPDVDAAALIDQACTEQI